MTPPETTTEARTALVPGVMHCARCKFQLTRTNLYVNSGTAGAGDSKTEPCPNGCGPLWPVTWEQAARDAWATCETLFERARVAEDALAAVNPPRLVGSPSTPEASAAPDAPSAEMEQDDTATWPEWAESILTFIRSQSGYDGYDDASEGIDLPMEVKEHVSELNNIIDRLTNEVAALAQPAPVQAPVEWGDPLTVGMFVRQLQTIAPETPIHAAVHTDLDGKRVALTKPVIISRERVSGRRIRQGDESVPYSIVVWAQQDEAKAPVQQDAPAPTMVGRQLVPVEPTDDMEAAAENDYEDTGATFPDWKSAYRAMLAASPEEKPAAIPFKRSVFRGSRANWTTFNIRTEHADEAAKRLTGTGTPAHAAPEPDDAPLETSEGDAR